jgi:hypothetical protein
MKKMKTLEDLRDIVESVGLGYAVTDGISPNTIEDREVRKLWSQARDILSEIESILEGAVDDNA